MKQLLIYIFLKKTHIKMIPFGCFELKYRWPTYLPPDFRAASLEDLGHGQTASEEPGHSDTGKQGQTSSANGSPYT